MKNLGILIFLLSLLGSCKINNKKVFDADSESTIPVEFINAYNVNDTSIYDEVQFIKLDNRNGFLLGEVKKLVVEDSLIYILTKGASVGLYVFKLDGAAMFMVGNRGKGAGEFVSISDFFIHKGIVYCSDPYQKRINRYNAQTGEFINSEDVNQIIKEIEGDDNYLYSICVKTEKKDTSLCKVFDLNYKVRYEYLSRNNKSYLKGRQLYKYNDNIYLIDETENRIVNIKNGQSINSYKFDFGKYNMTKKKYYNLDRQEILKRGIGCEISELCINAKVLTYKIVTRGSFYRLIYNMKENKAVCYNLLKTTSIESALNYQFADEKAVYSIVKPNVLRRLVEYAKGAEEYPFVIDLPQNTNINDNPYLVIKNVKHEIN